MNLIIKKSGFASVQQLPQPPKQMFRYFVVFFFQRPGKDQQKGKQTYFWVLIKWKSHIGTAGNFFCVIPLYKC